MGSEAAATMASEAEGRADRRGAWGPLLGSGLCCEEATAGPGAGGDRLTRVAVRGSKGPGPLLQGPGRGVQPSSWCVLGQCERDLGVCAARGLGALRVVVAWAADITVALHGGTVWRRGSKGAGASRVLPGRGDCRVAETFEGNKGKGALGPLRWELRGSVLSGLGCHKQTLLGVGRHVWTTRPWVPCPCPLQAPGVVGAGLRAVSWGPSGEEARFAHPWAAASAHAPAVHTDPAVARRLYVAFSPLGPRCRWDAVSVAWATRVRTSREGFLSLRCWTAWGSWFPHQQPARGPWPGRHEGQASSSGRGPEPAPLTVAPVAFLWGHPSCFERGMLSPLL